MAPNGYDNDAHAMAVKKAIDSLENDDIPVSARDSEAKTPLNCYESCLYWGCNILLTLLSAGLLALGGMFTVYPMESIVILAFGKIIRVESS